MVSFLSVASDSAALQSLFSKTIQFLKTDFVLWGFHMSLWSLFVTGFTLTIIYKFIMTILENAGGFSE